MKNIILLVATFTLGASMAVRAETIGSSGGGGGAELLVQNENQQVETGSTSGSGNNRNSKTVAVQQDRQNTPSGLASGSGGIGRFGGGYSYRLQNALSRYPGSGESPIVVRSSHMGPKDEANLEEDLAVMAHILDKTLEDLPSGQVHTRSAMGIDLFVSPNASTIRSMYVEGYGALFLLNVGSPLVAPATAAREEKPSRDSAWEEARQELYGQSEPQTLTSPGEEYSDEKVSRLKEALLRALKNASNIRGLEGDVTICVLGGANSASANAANAFGRVGVRSEGEVGQLLVTGPESAPLHGTILTIKVTKADVDAFAKGEIKFADFQDRARIAAYTTSSAHSNAAGVGYGFGSGSGGEALKR